MPEQQVACSCNKRPAQISTPRLNSFRSYVPDFADVLLHQVEQHVSEIRDVTPKTVQSRSYFRRQARTASGVQLQQATRPGKQTEIEQFLEFVPGNR